MPYPPCNPFMPTHLHGSSSRKGHEVAASHGVPLMNHQAPLIPPPDITSSRISTRPVPSNNYTLSLKCHLSWNLSMCQTYSLSFIATLCCTGHQSHVSLHPSLPFNTKVAFRFYCQKSTLHGSLLSLHILAAETLMPFVRD